MWILNSKSLFVGVRTIGVFLKLCVNKLRVTGTKDKGVEKISRETRELGLVGQAAHQDGSQGMLDAQTWSSGKKEGIRTSWDKRS